MIPVNRSTYMYYMLETQKMSKIQQSLMMDYKKFT